MTLTDSPTWARGWPLSHLKEAADMFRRVHKPHVYGAFGLVKERDVAAALPNDFWAVTRSTDLFDAVAIGHKLTRDSSHSDFSGRGIVLPRDSYFVKAFAAGSVDNAVWLFKIIAAKNNDLVVVEIFEEDLVAKEAMENIGLAYIGTKITAAGEIKGLYYSGDTRQHHTPAIQHLSLTCLHKFFVGDRIMEYIREELENYHEYNQHYSSYNKRKSWTAFSLSGFQPSDPGFIIKPAEMAKSWKEATPHKGWEKWKCTHTTVSHMFPTVWELLKSIPCHGFERVRFMRLAEKQGELSRHADITDKAAGPGTGQISRLHIPINTNDNVRFISWDERGERIEHNLPEGSLWYLDTRKPHSVLNEGNEPRVHLVADVVCNNQTQKLLLGGK